MKTTLALRRPWMTLATVLALLGFGSNANASCIYNHTEKTLGISLHCGWVCYNNWNMPAGEYRCRGGTGGLVVVNGGYPRHSSVRSQIFVHVEDHGYVVVSRGYKDWPSGNLGHEADEWYTVCSYRADHSVRECDPLIAPN